MSLRPLRLKKDRDRRLRAGHCWVYSNEVDTAVSPLKGLEPGEAVEIMDHRGRWLGSGYGNPHSLICARLVSRDPGHALDASLLVHRLKIALGLRQRLYRRPFYRLVFGESDGLPGLVVDRYDSLAVIQITTAGMERWKQEILAAVEKVLRPSGILLRNDTPVRQLEGLAVYCEVASGDIPELVEIEENGARFLVSPAGGQKTGWFFDQAANRTRMLRYLSAGRVLDVCAYLGAWGIQAAVGGATEVLCVDSSARAVAGIARNAELNARGECVRVLHQDAFDALKGLRDARERFDLVILDPPAFVKRKKDLAAGVQAYRRLNQLALPLLGREGYLFTSSCSFHMGRETFLGTVQQAARHVDRQLQLLETGQQAQDHPIHPAIPETGYLKTFCFRVLPRF